MLLKLRTMVKNAERIGAGLAVDEDGTWVRRRARRSEVAPADDADAVAALAVLTDRRLVVARADDLDIAHEALLTGWPRLLGWPRPRCWTAPQRWKLG